MTRASWPNRKFGELVATSAFGPRFSGSAYSDTGSVATLRTTDIDDDGRISYETMPLAELNVDDFANHLLLRRDLVVTRSGTCGVAAVFDEYALPVLPGAFLIRFRLNHQAEPEFYRYYFNSPVGRLNILSIARGAVQQNLNITNIENLYIPVPPVERQKGIVKILSSYDDLIENNRRRMALLEDAARQLYREWFVRLRFPGREHTRIDDGVPEGWERTTIADLVTRGAATLQTGPFGTQLRASEYVEQGTHVINVRNIGYGELRSEKIEFVPEDVVGRLSQHLLSVGDIVFGRKGAVDRHLLVTRITDGYLQGSDCIRMRVQPEELSSAMLSFAFREDAHRQWMVAQCSNKATMASLNQDVLGRIEVRIPPRPLRNQFDEVTGHIVRQIDNLHRQNEKLRAARDLLLPRLMSGELVV
jgi:type I restriction enzyme S subunit